MRVLVCGGRTYNRRDLVFRQLDLLHARIRISAIVHGAATGADSLAGEWARSRGIPEEPYPIEPGEGGFARNTRMLLQSRPDLVVHFPGRRGTRDMAEKARRAAVRVIGGLQRDLAEEAARQGTLL